ncbi:MAG: DUF1592 domain-containing protein [Opitutaceae bacterium]
MRTCASCLILLFLFAPLVSEAQAADQARADLEAAFNGKIRPFIETYCVSCHGAKKPEADLDFSAVTTLASLLKDGPRWSLMLERLTTEEMPPVEAKRHPTNEARREAIAWFQAVHQDEIRRHAGDPGTVLARRLTNAEFDYTIRDLTGVDLKPTREFPFDPSNMAGFDNSGESLAMSPTLLKKYLQAARDISSHLYLRADGFGFAPHPMLSETDRDKFCVQQIIDFYRGQNIDYADYFQAAWRFRHRAQLGRPEMTLAQCAQENRVSAKYLTTLWSVLEDERTQIGPMAKLQSLWQAIPAPRGADATLPRAGCEEMREYVVGVRKKVEMRFLNLNTGEGGTEWLPFLVWKNEQYAKHRRSFDPAQLQVKNEVPRPAEGRIRIEGGNQFGPGQTVLVENTPGDPDLFVPAGQRPRYEAAWARFCSVFPDMFYKDQRGRNYFRTGRDEGRYLSAGYHNVLGYFRDDQPFYELLLDEPEQAKLDEMWREFDFIAAANIRSYVQFAISGTRGARESFRDREPGVPVDAHLNDVQIASTPVIKKLEADYLARVTNGDDVAINAIKDYFRATDDGVRWVEQTRLAAEPSHLKALLEFAERAYRRPLSADDREDLLGFYRASRERNLDHEAAIREAIVVVLLSPKFSYRVDLAQAASGIKPLSDHDLASRLSYFLWSSMPDAELLGHAARGDLHQPEVMAAQARRLLQDPRSRALALEFGGNWLEFRRFESTGTVDLERFPSFTPQLRQAMFEEPIRFLLDVFQRNRSVLDFLYARDTFVNPVLAKHYGMPTSADPQDEWVHVADAARYERGGILPMAVFLTKNAPGLWTSPVKRGYWVAKNVLGDRIPPPPPTVPELPKDEAKLNLPLREMLARHRADPNCAACHARFDALGLVFEGFDPVGDRRQKDLAGRVIDANATFPGGGEGRGVEGLRQYVREKRQDDFIDNLCRKFLAYALGRSLMVSDDPLILDMRRQLAADGYRFDNLIKAIVTSPQFLNKRGRDDLAAN